MTGRRGGRSQSAPRESGNEVQSQPKDLDVEKDVTSFFVGSVSADQHYTGQEQNRDRYAAAMAVMQNNGIDIAQSK